MLLTVALVEVSYSKCFLKTLSFTQPDPISLATRAAEYSLVSQQMLPASRSSKGRKDVNCTVECQPGGTTLGGWRDQYLQALALLTEN